MSFCGNLISSLLWSILVAIGLYFPLKGLSGYPGKGPFTAEHKARLVAALVGLALIALLLHLAGGC